MNELRFKLGAKSLDKEFLKELVERQINRATAVLQSDHVHFERRLRVLERVSVEQRQSYSYGEPVCVMTPEGLPPTPKYSPALEE